MPALRILVLAGGLFLGIGIAAAPALRGRTATVVGLAALGVALAAPAAYAVSTVRTPHTGAIPTAGPAVARGGFGGPGGFRNLGGRAPNFGNGNGFPNFGNGNGFPNFGNGNGFPNFGNGNAGGLPGGGRSGVGGLLNGSEPGSEITALLKQSTGYRWTAAAVGANNAAGYQLASGQAIMAIGGFNGTDPTPTLAQFKAYVRAHAVHYFIASGGGLGGGGFGGGPGGSSSTSSEISQWVTSNFSAQTVDGVTIYDLSSGTS